MSLEKKSKTELLAIIEADRDVVKRARQAISDLAAEQARRVAAEAKVAELLPSARRLSRDVDEVKAYRARMNAIRGRG